MRAQPWGAQHSPYPAAASLPHAVAEILLQVGRVELRDPPVGSVLLRPSTLPQAGECQGTLWVVSPGDEWEGGTSQLPLASGVPAPSFIPRA